MTLPNEVLEQIFFYLSHRYIAQCSLVCKLWYDITRQPIFYHTVIISNSQQLNKFIQIIIMNNNNKQVGDDVRRLILGTYFLDTSLTINELKLLKQACPNITSFGNFFYYNNNNNNNNNDDDDDDDFMYFNALKYWSKLSELPYWFTYYGLYWHHRFLINDKNDKKMNQYTSLEFVIKKENIIQQSATNTNVNPFTKPNNKSSTFIQLIKDDHLRERKCMQIPITKNARMEGFENHDPIGYIEQFFETLQMNNGLIKHYGKAMKLPSSSYWSHLKHLDIDFSQVCAHTVLTLKSTFELDERTLESINTSCPSLTSLILRDLFINISCQYLEHVQTKPDDEFYSPCTKLERFELIDSTVQQKTFFHYLKKKYPQLSTLKLKLNWSTDEELVYAFERNLFTIALLHFIKSLKKLTHLSIKFMEIESSSDHHQRPYPWSNEEGMCFWYSSGFMKWLIQHPQQLKSFEFPFEFYHMDPFYYANDFFELAICESDSGSSQDDNNNNKNNNNKNQAEKIIGKRYYYLNHLEELYLTSEHNFLYTYFYLMDHMRNYRTVASTSITSLTLEFIGDDFDLFDEEDYEYDYKNHYYHDQYSGIIDKSYDNEEDFLGAMNDEGKKNKGGDLVHFYSWLSAFPKLKQLFIFNAALTDKGILNHCPCIPRKQIQSMPYGLTVLDLTYCKIKLKYGLTTIGESCPLLRILRLDNVHLIPGGNFDADPDFDGLDSNVECYDVNNENQLIFMNTPYLALDELWIKNIFIDYIHLEDYSNSQPIFTFNESINNKSFNIAYTDQHRHQQQQQGKKNKNKKKKSKGKQFTVIINIKHVDVINCGYDSSSY